MMKRTIMAVLLIAAALPLLSQEWEIKLEDYYPAIGINNSIVSSDGDVIFVGGAGPAATGRNPCVVKVGNDGEFEMYVYPNDTSCNISSFTDIVQLDNGNYFAYGLYRVGGTNYDWPFIMVIDKAFNMLTRRYIDVCGDSFLKCEAGPMVMDDDGNIIITCDVLVSTTGEINTWGCVLMKFSGEGEELKRNYITDDERLRGLFASSMLNVPGSDEILVLCRRYYEMVFFDSELNFLRGCEISNDDFFEWDSFGMFSGDGRLVVFLVIQDNLPTYPYIGDTMYARVCTIDFQGELTAWQDFKPTTGGRFVTDNVRRGFSPIDDRHGI